jgi:hypothetical protein
MGMKQKVMLNTLHLTKMAPAYGQLDRAVRNLKDPTTNGP